MKRTALDEQFYFDATKKDQPAVKIFHKDFEMQDVEIKRGVYHIWTTMVDGKTTKNLAGRTDLITRRTQISIIFDYPLREPVTFTFKSKSGFTKEQILKCIREGYRRIYKEEPQPAERNPMSFNRPRTDGKYGIWGHDIGDLVIAEVSIDNGVVRLAINS